jgi:hypothetical protein
MESELTEAHSEVKTGSEVGKEKGTAVGVVYNRTAPTGSFSSLGKARQGDRVGENEVRWAWNTDLAWKLR